MLPQQRFANLLRGLMLVGNAHGSIAISQPQKPESSRSALLIEVGAVALFLGIFFLVTARWALRTPEFNEAPDEQIHYTYNVLFIRQNGALPLSGRDDIALYKVCRNNPLGMLPCTVSYQVYPALGYAVTAGMMVVWEQFGLHGIMAARFASICWGLLYALSLYLIARQLMRELRPRLVALAPFLFLPQVIFIFSYVNQDNSSLALAALAAHAAIRLQRRWLKRDLIWCGAAVGFFLASKYNFLVLGIFLAGLPWYLQRVTGEGFPSAFRKSLWVYVIAYLVGSPWYLRNALLYGDPLGQKFMWSLMAQHHAYGTPLGFTRSAFQFLWQHNWLGTTMRSAIGLFGYMKHPLPERWYQGTAVLFACSVVCGTVDSIRLRSWSIFLAGLGALLFTCLMLALSLSSTLYVDYQAQGRYLFPALIPLGVAVFYWNQWSRLGRRVFILWAFATIGLLVRADMLLSMVYHRI